eukprot:74627-Chlamydomonas_euryale.AAC.4
METQTRDIHPFLHYLHAPTADDVQTVVPLTGRQFAVAAHACGHNENGMEMLWGRDNHYHYPACFPMIIFHGTGVVSSSATGWHPWVAS